LQQCTLISFLQIDYSLFQLSMIRYAQVVSSTSQKINAKDNCNGNGVELFFL
jgi:hypothetical protein